RYLVDGVKKSRATSTATVVTMAIFMIVAGEMAFGQQRAEHPSGPLDSGRVERTGTLGPSVPRFMSIVKNYHEEYQHFNLDSVNDPGSPTERELIIKDETYYCADTTVTRAFLNVR